MWSDFENYVPQKTLFQIRGKLWGKRVFLNRKILSPRFTGQTFFLYLPQQNGSALPHLRGADSGGTPATRVSGGSSPLTRGGHLLTSVEEPKTRLADPTYGVTVSVDEHFGQHSSRYGVELLMAQWFFA